MVAIDKIPIHLMQHSPGDETYHLGTITLTKGEYANAEKINQIIDILTKHDEKMASLERRIRKLEGRK